VVAEGGGNFLWEDELPEEHDDDDDDEEEEEALEACCFLGKGLLLARAEEGVGCLFKADKMVMFLLLMGSYLMRL
jgi:hypothetical protein